MKKQVDNLDKTPNPLYEDPAIVKEKLRQLFDRASESQEAQDENSPSEQSRVKGAPRQGKNFPPKDLEDKEDSFNKKSIQRGKTALKREKTAFSVQIVQPSQEKVEKLFNQILQGKTESHKVDSDNEDLQQGGTMDKSQQDNDEVSQTQLFAQDDQSLSEKNKHQKTSQTNKKTPMMQQYSRIKRQYSDYILFFRLGDFYEMFDQDAKQASDVLNLALTERNGVPMCGIPHHARSSYIKRLLQQGKKIAICEQVGAIGAGLVERKVTELFSPGLLVQEEYLEQNQNNYIALVATVKDPQKISKNKGCSLAYLDVSTGEFKGFTDFSKDWSLVRSALYEVAPKELVVNEYEWVYDPWIQQLGRDFQLKFPDTLIEKRAPWFFNLERGYQILLEHWQLLHLKGFGLNETHPAVLAAGALLEFAKQIENNDLSHVLTYSLHYDQDSVHIDQSTQNNLNLVYNPEEGNEKYTLYWALNRTQTNMGARLLKHWILHPLQNQWILEQRYQQVESFVSVGLDINDYQAKLKGVKDMQRLIARLCLFKATVLDLKNLEYSFAQYLQLNDHIKDQICLDELKLTQTEIRHLQQLHAVIHKALIENPSLQYGQGEIFRENWSKQLDQWTSLKTHSHDLLEQYLEKERKKTQLPLKLKYSRHSGYSLEVTHKRAELVPSYFKKKQSLANTERYTTDELMDLENKIISATENITTLELELLQHLTHHLVGHVSFMLSLADKIAQIDVYLSFAIHSIEYNYVRPTVKFNGYTQIIQGRHPVIERTFGKAKTFVSNPLFLDSLKQQPEQNNHSQHSEQPIPSIQANPSNALTPETQEGLQENHNKRFILLTGPNMAGKSTYLRQNALIILMAHIGCFVPAKQANIALVDKIFSRVGASDNLVKGESTFLVEMSEAAFILNTATERSFIIIDELGRGTSTQDGLSIAWAVCEYILNILKAQTLFATHFHELSTLEHPAIVNCSMAIEHDKKQLIFLRKLTYGAELNSYGVHVAQMAGLPLSVIERAKKILEDLEKNETGKSSEQGNILSQEKLEQQAAHNSEQAGDHTSEQGVFHSSFTEKTQTPESETTLSQWSQTELSILEKLKNLNVLDIKPLELMHMVTHWVDSLNNNH